MTAQTQQDIALATFNTIILCLYLAIFSRRIVPYLITPATLMWIHVIGNAMQEQNTGPEWARNHLHNLGVASCCMMAGSVLIPIARYRFRYATYVQTCMAVAKGALTGLFLGWSIGVVVCCIYEVLMVTSWRTQSLAQGYSGRLDWPDISAYFIGEALMLINFLVVMPRVLRKERRRLEMRGY